MHDDSTDLEKAIRRLAELQAMRRALDRTGSQRVVPTGELARGDWDRFVVPGPTGMH